jgi:hypothetical protein
MKYPDPDTERLITPGTPELEPDALNDSIVQGLLREKLPVTRENYLLLAGLEEPLDAEFESELPRQLRRLQS